jgi:ethanolamine utilization protein EutN
MDIGRIKGTVVTNVKSPDMGNLPLLLVEGANGVREVAVDTVSAGVGDEVLFVHGTAARLAVGNPNSTVDAAITAIIDTIDADIPADTA